MEKAFCCAPDFPVVQTNYGPVRGYRFREISSFKGIPYGRAVRFHAPQPPQPWAEPLDASSYGCVCPLLSIDKPGGELRVPHRYWVQDEDCPEHLDPGLRCPKAAGDGLAPWRRIFCRLVH